MKYLALLLCLYLCRTFGADIDTADGIPPEAQVLSGAPLVEYLRKSQNLFEVKETPTPGFKYMMMDMKFKDQTSNPVVKDDNDAGDDIPENYDPRITWANCSSFFTIRDQANCGSCWAVATASAISDRICIASKGKKQVYISATDILSCCRKCGSGCQGGYPIKAWQFFESDGVVTGGPYLDKKCCRSYQLHPCGHHGNHTYYGECPEMASTPPCKWRCQFGYRRRYWLDKRHGMPGKAYRLPNSVKEIQRDILKYGSVVGGMSIYGDFNHYKSGIYQHRGGLPGGYHAVKIIGWGKENGTDYWLIANSWNDDWGEKGFFRMLRGTNHCGIEENVIGGFVDLDSP
nr:Peptidase C1A domain containing protein [Haemonchus contortus]